MNRPERHVSILGGGPAGLAAADYSRKKDLRFTVYERNPWVGGNAVTYEYRGFRYDSGAHRIHDQDPDVTAEIRDLLGGRMIRIDAPSLVCHEGRFLIFPLTLQDLVRNLDPGTLIRAGLDLFRAKCAGGHPCADFRSYAEKGYGKTIAELFLINYSKKLWGIDPGRLSPQISGRRLLGLNFGSFLAESWSGLIRTVTGGNGSRKPQTNHVDGAFFYPSDGIGAIADRLADRCGRDHIVTGAEITRLEHRNRRIVRVEINGRTRVDVDRVLSTLPISLLPRLLDPEPPKPILDAAKRLRYRQVLLTVFLIDRETVFNAASVYFPDPSLPFTRISEPKLRSSRMAPPGKTSLVAEIPVWADAPLWKAGDDAAIQTVRRILLEKGWIKESEILGATAARLPDAYPVLEIGIQHDLDTLFNYVGTFDNLKVAGRNGLFEYAWIHDMFRISRERIHDDAG